MNKIEVQQTGGFPLETDSLEFMQSCWTVLGALGYIAGNTVILQGCVEVSGNVTAGYLYINGEVVRFDGGAIGSAIRIQETPITRIFQDGTEKVVFKERKAVFGTPGLAWSQFKRPKTTVNLTTLINELQPKAVPVGAIMMWAGAIGDIPTGWKLCDGNNGTPDLRSKFIVGYNDSDSDYNAIGKTGGTKTVTLTEGQMPKHSHDASSAGGHSHTYPDSYYIETGSELNGKTKVPGTSQESLPGSYAGSAGTDVNNNAILYRTRNTSSSPNHTHTISEKGNNEAHENRPPYYTLAFIQFKNA